MKTGIYQLLKILIVLIIIGSLILSSIIPAMIVVLMISIIAFIYISIKIKKEQIEKQKEKDRIFISQNYEKIDNNMYINKKDNKINILNKEYSFSQIIDSELIVNDADKLHRYCAEMYINITIEDFEKPNIRLDMKEAKLLLKESKKYEKILEKANKILSVLKIIISKNSEKYLEKGTVTKIEHTYVTQESIDMQIEKLSKLHKKGILTDYEFEIKKKELLDKNE